MGIDEQSGARFKSRKKVEQYEPLHERIPLSAPYSILIDSSSLCNLRCFFCPMGNENNKTKDISRRVNRHIEKELFQKIVTDVRAFGQQVKMLELGMHGEPFLNPELADNVRYAKQSGLFKRIGVVTNGTLLSAERAMPVIEAGIDQIDISLNGMSDEHFYEVTRKKIDFDGLVQNLTSLFENKQQTKITVKIMGDYLTDEQRSRFIEVFTPIADQIFVESLVPYWNDLDIEWPEATSTMLGETIHRESEVCPFPFYKMRITSDGKALLCSADWDHLRPIGDLREQSIKEIWESDTLRRIQLKFLRGERDSLEGCSDCEMFRYTQLVHLDPHRVEMLQKFESFLRGSGKGYLLGEGSSARQSVIGRGR